MQLERQKAALDDMVRQLLGDQKESQQQLEQLRQELKKEQENGQVSLTSQVAELGRAVMGTRTGDMRKGEARTIAGTGSTEPGRLQR